MKKNIIGLFIAVSTCFSCSDFLEEDNKSNQTADKMYKTESGYESLINSCYAPLRALHKQRDLLMFATDLFDQNLDPKVEGPKGALTTFNEYHPQSYHSQCKQFATYFDLCYEAIARTNAAVDRAAAAEITVAKQQLRTAEAKTLRALYYFYMVEQFGDIPIMLEEVKTVITTGQRDPEQLIYTQIINDMEESIPLLPAVATDYGRVTQGMAKHLLAKIYLTRAYKKYASTTDFEKANRLALEVINTKEYGYELLNNFGKVFEVGNEKNQEIVFAIQYSDNTLYNGPSTSPSFYYGNNSHMPFGCTFDEIPGMERNSIYGRMQALTSPSKFLYTLYDWKVDSRYDDTFLRYFLATKKSGSINVGDTTLFFPRPGESWSAEKAASKPYIVMNWEEYKYKISDLKNGYQPPIWKFREPNIPYGDDQGQRDFFFFRLAETYLVVAEAYLGMGRADLALPYVNAIRERAAVDAGHKTAMQATASDITIDFILDERARELAGEEARWMELKRCGKLVERVLLHNERARAANQITDIHTVRPLPYSWFERLSNRDEVVQNPGFDK